MIEMIMTTIMIVFKVNIDVIDDGVCGSCS